MKKIRLYIRGVFFKMGDRITDSRYGVGTIKKIEKAKDGYWVTVMFDDESIGEKRFLSFINPMESKK